MPTEMEGSFFMFYTPNPIVEKALREAGGYCSQATAQLEGIEMKWGKNPARENDYPRVQGLLRSVRRLGGSDEPTELVPRPRISELENVIATIEAWREPVLDQIGVPLKRALSILTECAKTVGVSDTGLAS
jgi:hypothetical protein